MNTTENRILDYSEPSKPKLEYADFGIRLAASILDFFVFLSILLFFVYLFVYTEWFMEYILDESRSIILVFLYFLVRHLSVLCIMPFSNAANFKVVLEK